MGRFEFTPTMLQKQCHVDYWPMDTLFIIYDGLWTLLGVLGGHIRAVHVNVPFIDSKHIL